MVDAFEPDRERRYSPLSFEGEGEGEYSEPGEPGVDPEYAEEVGEAKNEEVEAPETGDSA